MKKIKVTNMKKDEWILFGVVFVIAMAAMVSFANADDSQYSRIKDHCRTQWLTDYEMQEYCYKNQVTAMHKVADRYYPYTKDFDMADYDHIADVLAETVIVLTCLMKWRDKSFDTWNWQMVLYCCDNQFKAYNRMKD